jgi:hypothetical protein
MGKIYIKTNKQCQRKQNHFFRRSNNRVYRNGSAGNAADWQPDDLGFKSRILSANFFFDTPYYLLIHVIIDGNYAYTWLLTAMTNNKAFMLIGVLSKRF